MTVLERQADLAQVVQILEESASDLRIPSEMRERAIRRAVLALEGAEGDAVAGANAVLDFAADIVSAAAVELASRPTVLQALLGRLQNDTAINRVRLGRAVLSKPQLLQLPTAVALEVELALLLVFSRATSISLWTLWPDGSLKHLGHAGDFSERTRQTRQLARALLSGEATPQRKSSAVAGVLLERHHGPRAALIVKGRNVSSAECMSLLETARPMTIAILEWDELLTRRTGFEDLAASSERRLDRVRYDLHDGPQQDVILLGEDLRLFRSQLESVLRGNPNKDRVIGRIDDLQARLVALDGDLRRISVAVESPFMQQGALPDTLAQITDEFASRTGIEPDVRLEGDFSELTDSQYIALVGLIREALSNIREHSDAKHVSIHLAAGGAGVDARVADDGRGFDPEKTLVRAARAGHLGLVGMHERVRMLGGRAEIDSRPGGPTVISIGLPPAPEAAPRRKEQRSQRGTVKR